MDNTVVTGKEAKIRNLKAYLENESIKDLEELKYLYRVEVPRSKNSLIILQRKYTLDLLEETRQ